MEMKKGNIISDKISEMLESTCYFDSVSQVADRYREKYGKEAQAVVLKMILAWDETTKHGAEMLSFWKLVYDDLCLDSL